MPQAARRTSPRLRGEEAAGDPPILTSSAKLVAWVFFIILARWTSTVLALMPSSWAMVLFGCPLSKPASTSFSLLLKVANLSLIICVSASGAGSLSPRVNAARMESSRASPSNGFSKKFIAPRFIAATASGTSPCAVMTMTGMETRRSFISANKSSPLIPGMRTSVTRQPQSSCWIISRNVRADSCARTA